MWSRLWQITRIAFRSLAALFMAVVVAGALYLGWDLIEDRRLENTVSKTRTWEKVTIPLSQTVLVTLKTRCSESQLYYILTIQPPDKPDKPPEKTSPIVRSSSLVNAVGRINDFHIQFADLDGFKIVSVRLKNADFVKLVDDKGQVEAYEANGITPCIIEICINNGRL